MLTLGRTAQGLRRFCPSAVLPTPERGGNVAAKGEVLVAAPSRGLIATLMNWGPSPTVWRAFCVRDRTGAVRVEVAIRSGSRAPGRLGDWGVIFALWGGASVNPREAGPVIGWFGAPSVASR